MTDAPEQRSPEWFKQRVGRVTGSRVAAILGLSPWQSRSDVMRAMVREREGAESEFSGNPATAHGNFHEDAAAFEFTLETGIKVTPAPFIPYEEWLGASPDNYTSDNGVAEYKCPYSLFKKADPVFKSALEQPHYMAQMDIEMFCANVDHCHFFQHVPARTIDGVWREAVSHHEVVQRNDAWLNENLPKLKQFWDEYCDEPSEDHLATKRIEIDTPEAAKSIREWDELTIQIEQLTERKADLLAEMVCIAKDKNAILAGRKLTRTERAGSVAYAKIVKAKLPDLDLEPFRGKPSSFWKLT